MSRRSLMRRVPGSALVGAVLFLLGGSAAAAVVDAASPAVAVRVGSHPGFARIVFDLPAGASVETATEGSRLLLVFSGVERLRLPSVVPRNVVAFKADGATATLALQTGAETRTVRLGDRLIVDVLDARDAGQGGAAGAGASRPALASAGRGEPGVRSARPDRGGAARPGAGPGLAEPAAAQASPIVSGPTVSGSIVTGATVSGPTVRGPTVSEGAGPQPGRLGPEASQPGGAEFGGVVPVREPPRPEDDSVGTGAGAPMAAGSVVAAVPPLPVERQDVVPPARAEPSPAPVPVVLPADASVGAAAFRREGFAVIVLDRRLPIPPPGGLPGAVVIPGAVDTVVEFPLAADRDVQLVRVPSGWAVAVVAAGAPGQMQVAGDAEGLLFPMARQGRPVTVTDPVSGDTLLVGTSLADGPMNAVGLARRGPEYAVLPSWLGVAVEPLSDQEDLRPGQAGFLLRGAGPGARLAELPMDHRFDLPNEPMPALLNRMNLQLASAAAAQPRARTASRLAGAQAMLALGLGVEAEALLGQTAADDPQAAADVQLPTLMAMAAVLAGRLDEADALDDPRLQDVPEAQLWRGLRDRRLGRDTPAARDLGMRRAIAQGYPEPLRRAVWPDIAEAAVEAGTTLPAGQLTPFAAALLLERQGKTGEALDAWHALADGPDKLERVRASRRAIELELASGQIGAGAASDRYEGLSVAWRGDAQELGFRLRAAELRAAAGQWRQALDTLRETDPLFPAQHEEVKRGKTAVFEAMLSAEGAGLSPMDLILLASDFADCVADDASGAKLAALLADKLMTLDLSARAVPVLEGLMKATAAGPARAEFGTRLAQLLLEAGDDKGAISALAASAAPALPGDTVTMRALLKAKAQAAGGRVQDAVDGLQQLAVPEADDLRAVLLAKSGDWRGSLSALSDLAAKAVPASGPLDPAAQAIVVREATAAAQAPDAEMLRSLQGQLPRMSGSQAELVRVLTEAPITSARDLPRAATELALARNIPQQIRSAGKR